MDIYSDCNTVSIDLEIGILSFKAGIEKFNQRISWFRLLQSSKTWEFCMLLLFLLLRWCAKSPTVEGYSYPIKKDETCNLQKNTNPNPPSPQEKNKHKTNETLTNTSTEFCKDICLNSSRFKYILLQNAICTLLSQHE